MNNNNEIWENEDEESDEQWMCELMRAFRGIPPSKSMKYCDLWYVTYFNDGTLKAFGATFCKLFGMWIILSLSQ